MLKHGSSLILFKDNSKKEVFLVYRSDYPIWGITGGAMEKGETPLETALREAHEETGFEVKMVRKVGMYKRKTKEGVVKSHLFEGRVVSGRFKPEFPGCRGKWFKVNRLPISMLNHAKEKVKDCIRVYPKEFVKKTEPLTSYKNFHLLLLHPISMFKYFLTHRT